MPLHVSSTCAHHQEVKIALQSLWYHHDTTGCVMQFWRYFIYIHTFIVNILKHSMLKL